MDPNNDTRSGTFRSVCAHIFLPLICFLIFVFIIHFLTNIPFSRLTRDPLSLAKLSPLHGIVSNVGILIWCATASICFFAAIILKKRGGTHVSNFLFFSGLITSLLLLDDFFTIHESLRDYVGISEKITYAVYVVIIGIYLFRYRHDIWNRHVLLLILGSVFFGISVGLDLFQKNAVNILPGYFFIEDGIKLLGIASWAGYYSYTSLECIMGGRFPEDPGMMTGLTPHASD